VSSRAAGAGPGAAATEQTLEGQTFTGGSLLSRYASFVKLPHTLFALPFAGVGAILGSRVAPERLTVLSGLWIVLAFTAARFAAMGFNRIVDRVYDGLNPRTRRRELPSGQLTLAQAVAAVLVASALFIVLSWQLNPLCGWLSPLALLWIYSYSYAKRVTLLAHHMLGFALGIAPVGAYLAVTGVWSSPWFALVILAGGVTFWVAGFDVIYALQDVEFDRAHGLHSIPARIGAARGIRMARAFHVLSFALFLSLYWIASFKLGVLYLAGVAVMAALLVYEHAVVGDADPAKLDLPRIDRAFFRANIAVSLSIFAFTLLDRLVA
jgi:4-hydroxybenzoate polyprenyltransferase